MSKTMIIRIMVPHDDNTAVASGFVGHYDLQIVGTNLSFMNESFNNPVFSFEPQKSTSVGLLHVFNGSDSSLVYPENDDRFIKCDVYRLTEQISDAQYAKFLNHLYGSISERYEPSNPQDAVGFYYCYPSTNIFYKYSKYYVNCYRAVATWVRAMGIDSLWNIFAAAYPEHLEYSARAMVDKYSIPAGWYKAIST